MSQQLRIRAGQDPCPGVWLFRGMGLVSMELVRGSMAKGLIHDYRLGQSLAYRVGGDGQGCWCLFFPLQSKFTKHPLHARPHVGFGEQEVSESRGRS